MSFNACQAVVPRSSRGEPVEGCGDSDTHSRPQTHPTTLDYLEESLCSPADDEGIHSVRLKLQGPEKQCQKSLPAEESEEARLERLGRQRPEVFDSIWSEIGFVFSISMSQVLSVCTP